MSLKLPKRILTARSTLLQKMQQIKNKSVTDLREVNQIIFKNIRKSENSFRIEKNVYADDVFFVFSFLELDCKGAQQYFISISVIMVS